MRLEYKKIKQIVVATLATRITYIVIPDKGQLNHYNIVEIFLSANLG